MIRRVPGTPGLDQARHVPDSSTRQMTANADLSHLKVDDQVDELALSAPMSER